MTTSNSINFTINAAECIETAFKLINVLNEGDYLAEADAGLGLRLLNLMIKGWQSYNNSLWIKQTAVLFLQKAQSRYIISGTTTDHFTADTLASTTLTADAALGSSSITVSDSSAFSVNDYIGIKQDNNYFHWSTVSGVPDSTTIQINNVTTYAASSGNYVYGYTNQLDVPFQVYLGVRHDIGANTDIRISQLSYSDYLVQPVKSSQGVPIMWSYDRQREYYALNIWPTPADVSNYLSFIISRKIQDIDSIANDFDFPQEWELAITYGLAVMLAPAYGKAQGDNFAELRRQAEEFKTMALNNDTELGSIYLQPSFELQRRPL